ncbi:50S ribosomal protein L10 [Candidatus Woesearchaeota archaeon]|nr:50S ribosomal protein L10 [Candidatus Woesearchaeota archaeon]
MNKRTAHVSQNKKNEVDYIKKLMQTYKVILIADLTNLPSAQLQSIKTKLKKDMIIRVTKKRLMRIAIQQLKDKKDLTRLDSYLDECMPALLVTNEDPFTIYKSIKKSKSYIAAKPGQIAPSDLTVEPGPTNFPPGPIIGELGQAGIVAAVEGGKVVIKRKSVLAKEGQEITAKAAGILAKLGVEPIEVGLNVVVAIDDGIIYEKSVLDVDEKEYLNNLRKAHFEAVSLAVGVSYISIGSIKLLLGKAQREMLALSKNIKLDEKADKPEGKEQKPEELKIEIKEEIREASAEMKPKEKAEEPKKEKSSSVFSKEAETKAQEILNKLKEADINKKKYKR